MRVRLGAVLPTAITIAFGFIVLLGLLVGDDLGAASTVVRTYGIRDIANFSVQLLSITLALVVFIGVINLLVVHLRRIGGRRAGFLYSVVMLSSFALAVAAHVLARDDLSRLLLEDVQIPIESALAALLFFALVYGAATVLQRRATWSGLLFVAVVVLVLLAAIPLAQLEPIRQLNAWVQAVPVNAGARGILLGIALATVVAGIRVLIGTDRSYRE